MASSSIQLPTDGTGKHLASETWDQAGTTVHGQKLLICDAAGNVVGVTSNRLRVDGSGVTQPVSAASLPLPSGASTEATLAGVKTGTDKIPTSPAQEHTTAGSPHSVRLTDGTAYIGTTASRLHVDDGGSSLSVDDNGGSLTVDGTVAVSNFPGTQAVSGTVSVGNFPGTQPVSGTVSVGNFPGTQTVSGTVTANPPTITKGTQGANGNTVQQLRDAGRAQIALAWEEMAGTANAESALTNHTSASRNGSTVAAATSLTAAATKTLRIEEITIYVKATSTVNNLARFRLRQAATVANNSPIIWSKVLALPLGTAAAGAFQALVCPISEGLEVPAGQQITFTWLTAANTCTVGLSLTGYEY